jgi:hypothetical protein
MQWDGKRLTSLPTGPIPMHSTSSYLSTEVLAERAERFRQIVEEKNPDSHTAFHRQHDANRPAHSVWMEREDAWTVSLTRLDLTYSLAQMTYENRHTPPTAVRLEQTSK